MERSEETMSEHLSATKLRRATHQMQEWLKELASREPFSTEDQAYGFLRAVLHALRDRLTVEEAAHLGQQLPMIARGFYFEGWRPALAPNEFETRAEFLGRIQESLGGGAPSAGPGGIAIDEGTATILRYLDEALPDGTVRHVVDQLPEEIEALFLEAAGA